MPTFNLAKVAALVGRHNFKRVVLQFPDENLEHCTDVFKHLQDLLGHESDVHIYITADSTYGSSVDDISAQHVDGDVLVYFGNDLSSSGAMPVMVVPSQCEVDVDHCAESLSQLHAAASASGAYDTILLLYEPGCYHSIAPLVALLERPGLTMHVASLPPCADLDDWNVSTVAEVVAAEAADAARAPKGGKVSSGSGPFVTSSPGMSGLIRLGGLLIPEAHIHADTASSTVIYYIGDKQQQRDNILLHLSQHTVLSYSPLKRAVSQVVGAETKVFRQRYLGVQAVSAAKTIGIIVGSMGLTGETTRDIIRRLQLLIEAGGKRYYTFVMGRLNEAKICNFPEIDVFCFISNEDISVIAPKTFDRPVITPWELELGLGAREWDSSYQLDPMAIMGRREDGQATRDAQFEVALQRARAARPEGNGIDDLEDIGAEGGAEGEGEGRLVVPGTRALALFHSAAGEFFQQREYQGLDPDVAQGHSTEVQQGLFGIAAGYERK